MNRLTKIIKGKCGHDQIYYTPKYGNPITPIDMTDWGYNTLANHLYDILNRLKRYEDLEEQGLLIKLPCKVGDKVYTIFCDKVYEKTIDKIIINRFTTPQIWVETKLSFATSSLERWDIVIGKTVFLTREEAEKALEATNE